MKHSQLFWKSFWKTNKFLILILIFSISLRAIQWSDNEVWWDSSVYIGMGKYIFSNGQIGLWEDSRPLILPFLLGGFWKIGIDPIIAGKFLILFFSVGCIALTYLIAKQLFNEQTAILSSLLLSFFPSFFRLGTQILSDIPSLFFSLLGIYLYFNRKYFLSGLMLCIAFMTRFLHLGVFAVIIGIETLLLIIIFISKSKQHASKLKSGKLQSYLTSKLYKKRTLILMLLFGFLLLFLPYLLLNYLLYPNPLQPFLRQVFMSNYTGWMWWEPFSFYITNFISESIITFFSVIGLGAIIIHLVSLTKSCPKLTIKQKSPLINFIVNSKNEVVRGILILISLFVVYFAYFSYISHKEMRFSFTFLPYLLIISSFGLLQTLNYLSNLKLKIKIKKFIQVFLLFTVLLICIFQSFFTFHILNKQDPRIKNEIQNHLLTLETQLKTDKGYSKFVELWISSPDYLLYSNSKAKELLYYPTFDSKRAQEILDKLTQTDEKKSTLILINPCDMPCPPWDKECSSKKEAVILEMKTKFASVLNSLSSRFGNNPSCPDLIFKN